MTEMSDKWDKQWRELLTHCHGENIEANAEFKSGLLDGLKNKVRESAPEIASDFVPETAPETVVTDEAEEKNWGRLLKAAYIPCHPEEGFKSGLLGELKNRQSANVRNEPAAANPNETSEDRAMRTILTRSYQRVTPRKEFETRLLDNLKERQRVTSVMRKTSRRRTLFLSAASGIAAAAMVTFVLWTNPVGTASNPANVNTINNSGLESAHTFSATNDIAATSSESSSAHASLALPIPSRTELASAAPVSRGDLRLPLPSIQPVSTVPVAFDNDAFFGDGPRAVASAHAFSDMMPASFETVPASFTSYRVHDAFSGPALPETAMALQNIEIDSGDGWRALGEAVEFSLAAGLAMRSRGGMGHLKFADGSIITVSPNATMRATDEGLEIERGLALVSVPDNTRAGFRLHFPERDIAIEPGTDLAVMVDCPDEYAEGGAPAPTVMVVDRHDSPGGLALARSDKGVGPLLAKQVYRLDRYVTADLPGRSLCETECLELDNFFKMEAVRQVGQPMASFAGGFAGDRDMGYTAMIVTPAGYTKKGERWVSDRYDGRQTIQFKYLSDAYFGFANARRDLARDLSLGAQVVIDGGDGKFYEIVK